MYHFWYIAFSCGSGFSLGLLKKRPRCTIFGTLLFSCELGFYLGFEKSAYSNVPFLVHWNRQKEKHFSSSSRFLEKEQRKVA